MLLKIQEEEFKENINPNKSQSMKDT